MKLVRMSSGISILKVVTITLKLNDAREVRPDGSGEKQRDGMQMVRKAVDVRRPWSQG